MNLKNIFFATFVLLIPATAVPMAQRKLGQFKFNAAWVLPYSTRKKTGERIFLIGREAGGSDKGTWDAFGGKKDKNEWHPDQTASREFYEETVGLAFNNLKDAKEYIAVKDKNKKNHSTVVIARDSKQCVLFLTKFKYPHLKQVADNFYVARAKAKSYKEREKDQIAFVSESKLKAAILNTKSNQAVVVAADVVQPNGNRTNQQITIRTILSDMLRPYYQNRNYQPGNKPQIRFYQ